MSIMNRNRRLSVSLILFLGIILLSNVSANAQASTHTLYLPLIMRAPSPSIFGFEVATTITATSISARAKDLGAYWMRINTVQWSKIEPTRGAQYDWTSLSSFNLSLNKSRDLGLNPVVVIRGTPLWAAVTGSNCAAVKDEYLTDYANFLAALVSRYRDQVIYWELGNEPDVDPSLVASNAPYGCWGAINDTYYGGERYGRMLRAVVPAMRAANPAVKIVFGGLLLSSPNTTTSELGKPELFLEGALRAGAADYFDILAYHSYPAYLQANYDHDLYVENTWTSLGGWTLGKAAYLRAVMARYGVSKPLWLNETGLVCKLLNGSCTQVTSAFFDTQADHLVRLMSRAAASNIQQVSWFTLDGPGWRYGGLLDANQNPRPAYTAYKRLIGLVSDYRSVSKMADYGSAVEAYRFVKATEVVDVLWSTSGNTVAVRVPINSYRSAVIWDGTAPTITQSLTYKSISVGFKAVFIVRAP
ncbi:MAG: cellulase family glycosylhydrolase [Oscillochloris sp.]|nr:cellulase family glycosylhydrolase [Oscillochloris sp.]